MRAVNAASNSSAVMSARPADDAPRPVGKVGSAVGDVVMVAAAQVLSTVCFPRCSVARRGRAGDSSWRVRPLPDAPAVRFLPVGRVTKPAAVVTSATSDSVDLAPAGTTQILCRRDPAVLHNGRLPRERAVHPPR
jgi:hypothetical protein